MDGKSFLSVSSISVSVTTTVVTSGRLTSLHGAPAGRAGSGQGQVNNTDLYFENYTVGMCCQINDIHCLPSKLYIRSASHTSCLTIDIACV